MKKFTQTDGRDERNCAENVPNKNTSEVKSTNAVRKAPTRVKSQHKN